MKTTTNSFLPWFKDYFNQVSSDFVIKKDKQPRRAALGAKQQILIVDSEWNILKLLYSYLKPYYEPVVKDCPVKALKWIHEGNNPALIICEYQLPHFNGASFIQFIKGSGLYHETPVIILSGEDGFEQKTKNLPFAVEGIIRKPFDPTHLKITIQKVLNEYEPRFHY